MLIHRFNVNIRSSLLQTKKKHHVAAKVVNKFSAFGTIHVSDRLSSFFVGEFDGKVG